MDAEAAGGSGHVRDSSAMDQELARDAADVQAGAAPGLPKDEGDPGAGADRQVRHHGAGLAGAEDDRIELTSLVHGIGAPPSRRTMSRWSFSLLASNDRSSSLA